MTMESLAQKSDLSKSMISKIERDKVGITVNSLWKLSHALGVSVGYFFNEIEKDDNLVVRSDQRKKIQLSNSSAIYESLTPNLTGKIEFLRVVIDPNDKVNEKKISHRGEECGIVLKGKLLVKLGDREYTLYNGDSIQFNSTIPHKYINIGEETCVSIWAMTPPSF